MRRSEYRRRSRRKARRARAPQRQAVTSVMKPVATTVRDDASDQIQGKDVERKPFAPPSTNDIPDLTAQELLINAARHAAGAGEPDRAAAIYRELLEISPSHLTARKELALHLSETRNHSEALEHLDRCIMEDPDDVDCLTRRAAVLGTRGEFEDAESDLHRALSVDPTNVQGHHQLGLLMSRRALWTDALPFFRRAIELDPGSASAYRHLGDALNHVDNLQGALQAYGRSVELAPHDAKALRGLGVIHDRLGQPEAAAAMYRRSREMDSP